MSKLEKLLEPYEGNMFLPLSFDHWFQYKQITGKPKKSYQGPIFISETKLATTAKINTGTNAEINAKLDNSKVDAKHGAVNVKTDTFTSTSVSNVSNATNVLNVSRIGYEHDDLLLQLAFHGKEYAALPLEPTSFINYVKTDPNGLGVLQEDKRYKMAEQVFQHFKYKLVLYRLAPADMMDLAKTECLKQLSKHSEEDVNEYYQGQQPKFWYFIDNFVKVYLKHYETNHNPEMATLLQYLNSHQSSHQSLPMINDQQIKLLFRLFLLFSNNYVEPQHKDDVLQCLVFYKLFGFKLVKILIT